MLAMLLLKKGDGDIMNTSIHPSIRLSHNLLLNPLAEFNQTCYITSPHGKGVGEQHYFSIYCLSVRPSVCHTISS